MPEDWYAWHDNYRRHRGLQARLDLVCEHIASSMTACAPGVIRVVSVCAGDGRDLIGAMIAHPRAGDIQARLVEQDPRLVDAGQSCADLSDLGPQLKFVRGDATLFSAYRGAAPADLVLVCGVFGHVREENLAQLVRGLAVLCRPNGRVIWTRSMKAWDGERHVALIREYFRESGFEEVRFEKASVGESAIGTYQYVGPALDFPISREMFIFSGSDFDQTEVNA
jgi:hypothetical protein